MYTVRQKGAGKRKLDRPCRRGRLTDVGVDVKLQKVKKTVVYACIIQKIYHIYEMESSDVQLCVLLQGISST
jgi:hypothetical protein